MKQTRLSSFTEAMVNVAIGYAVNVAANFLIFPLFGWTISLRQNIFLGVWYTAVSVARSYALRRWFNAWIHRKLG